MIFLGVIVGLIVLICLVVAHEFGHFLMARKNGVTVEEFGIGFPPRAVAWVKNPEYEEWQKQKKSAKEKGKDFTEKRPKKWLKFPRKDWGKKQKTLIFSINFLPIGGFCSMKGESDSDRRPHAFGSASYWQKTKILFGGVLMNWLTAFIILTILAWTGMPHFIAGQFSVSGDTTVYYKPVTIGEVMKETPAADAGLEPGDQIIAINGEIVESSDDVIRINNDHVGQIVDYQIIPAAEAVESCSNNDGQLYCTDDVKIVQLKLNEAGAQYVLGVSMNQDQSLYRSTWSAPIVGAVTTLQLTGETFKGLGSAVGNLFSGVFKQFSPDEATREEGRSAVQTAGDSMSGPVGIIGIIFPNLVSTGITNTAFIAALISVSLACMNVLPIPALDGGRWLLITIFKLRKKTLTKQTEEKIVSRAFIVLLALVAIITILDVVRIATR